MKSVLNILAQAENSEISQTTGITAEKIEKGGETTAVTTVPGDQPAEQPAKPQQKAPTTTWLFLGLMFVMLYFVMFRGPRKKQQQHSKMIKALEKNDRVQTIGGIIGTVLDVKDNEVTLKVDESNNTKIKVTVGAIGKKITKE